MAASSGPDAVRFTALRRSWPREALLALLAVLTGGLVLLAAAWAPARAARLRFAPPPASGSGRGGAAGVLLAEDEVRRSLINNRPARRGVL